MGCNQRDGILKDCVSPTISIVEIEMNPNKLTKLRIYYVRTKLASQLTFLRSHCRGDSGRLSFLLRTCHNGSDVLVRSSEYTDLQRLVQDRIRTVEARLERVTQYESRT